MSKLNWTKAKKHRGFTPTIEKKEQPAKGGWTHIKRQPMKTFTAEEIANWTTINGDRLGKEHG